MLAVIQSEAIYLWYYFSIQFPPIVLYWTISLLGIFDILRVSIFHAGNVPM